MHNKVPFLSSFQVADDLRSELGVYEKGAHPVSSITPGIKTPNLDKLAGKSILFNRAYCQYALCGPSRTSVLTSRRPDTTQGDNNLRTPIPSISSQIYRVIWKSCHNYCNVLSKNFDFMKINPTMSPAYSSDSIWICLVLLISSGSGLSSGSFDEIIIIFIEEWRLACSSHCN